MILVILTPITQGIWSNDNFLHGHDDTEFNLFMALTLVLLALLICRHYQNVLDKVLSSFQDVLTFLLRLFGEQTLSAPVKDVSPACDHDRVSPSEASAYLLPLLI
jgi:hypothetical protein